MCTNTQAKKNILLVNSCVCVHVKLRDVSSQQEKYVQCGGTFRGLTQKADLSLLPGPGPSKPGRRKDLRGWGSVLGIHPEPTLKTDNARPHQPWRSNRAKMQAVNQEGFAMPVFNYWHFQRCKSVLSTQQEKIHLHFALTQLVASDHGLSLLQYDELAVNKVELQCCCMKDTNIVFTYTLKLRINKTLESLRNKCIYFCTLWQGQTLMGGILRVPALFRVLIKHQAPNMYFQILLLLDKLYSVSRST